MEKINNRFNKFICSLLSFIIVFSCVFSVSIADNEPDAEIPETTVTEESDTQSTATPTPTEEVTDPRISQIGDFVDRLYSYVLFRTCDRAGKDYWVDLLVSGEKNGAEVAYGFFFSDEFLNKDISDERYINDLYLVFMNRNADTQGYEYWLDKIQNEEYTREMVFYGFVDSNEWANICVSYGIFSGGTGEITVVPPISDEIKTFVASLYRDCLDREPDTNGFNDWCEKLVTMQATGKEAAFGFFFSQEFINKTKDMTPSDIITIYYKVFLNRLPDRAGIEHWEEVMSQRDELVTSFQGLDELFSGFADSQEFLRKCRLYGIICGDHLDVPDVPRSIFDYSTVTYPTDVTTLMDVYIRRNLITSADISGIQDELIRQGEYWVEQNQTTGNPRYVFGGKVLTWGCGVDCSGYVTITYRRALGTMIQPNSSISGQIYNSANYIQSMYNYGTVNVGGRFYQNYPMNEGIFRTRDNRTVYVDKFGIGSAILMNTYQWIYYLKQLGVSYTQIDMINLQTNDDWSFVDSYQPGDIILWWDGKPFETTDPDSWHIGYYDGNGGVYHSSSVDTSNFEHNYIGVQWSQINDIMRETHDERTIIIFHCFPSPES